MNDWRQSSKDRHQVLHFLVVASLATAKRMVRLEHDEKTIASNAFVSSLSFVSASTVQNSKKWYISYILNNFIAKRKLPAIRVVIWKKFGIYILEQILHHSVYDVTDF